MNDSLDSCRWWNRYRDRLTEDVTHRLDLYLRSLAPRGGSDRSRRVLDSVEALAANDVVDDVRVSVWGDRLCLDDAFATTEPGRMMLDTVERIQEWGGDDEASARSYFQEREVHNSITGAEYTVVVPPEMCLCIHLDTQLSGVFPARIDGHEYSIADYIDRVRALSDIDSQALWQ
jgi:hypothetical protein